MRVVGDGGGGVEKNQDALNDKSLRRRLNGNARDRSSGSKSRGVAEDAQGGRACYGRDFACDEHLLIHELLNTFRFLKNIG